MKKNIIGNRVLFLKRFKLFCAVGYAGLKNYLFSESDGFGELGLSFVFDTGS